MGLALDYGAGLRLLAYRPSQSLLVGHLRRSDQSQVDVVGSKSISSDRM